MAERIPQAAAVRVPLQTYLASDHVTPATGLTVAIEISKNGAAYGNPNAGATSATEIANGSYCVDLDAPDTGTLGPLFVRGTSATMDPVVAIYNVVAVPDVNVTAIGGTAQTGLDVGATLGVAGAGLTALGDTRLVNLDAAVSSCSTQASVDDLPTNGELATALGTADDAALAAIEALQTHGDSTWTPPTAVAIADQVWDEVSAGHVTVGTTGKLLSAAGIAANPLLDTVPGDYAPGTAGYKLGYVDTDGSGAIAWTYTITDSVSGDPIADVDVWVTSDAPGVSVLASGRTNQSGVVTFYLDAGTVYVWRQKSGYVFTNPDSEVVV